MPIALEWNKLTLNRYLHIIFFPQCLLFRKISHDKHRLTDRSKDIHVIKCETRLKIKWQLDSKIPFTFTEK